MVSFSWRISPETLTVIFFDRSPCATAVVTSAMLRTCPVKLDAMELTESVRSGAGTGRRGHLEGPHRLSQFHGVQFDRAGAQHRGCDDRGFTRRFEPQDHGGGEGRNP